MATAPGHRLGQIIGDALEASVAPVLSEFAEEHGLYLDTKGPRAARRGVKVTWKDAAGNRHDLDFVIERGGTDVSVGQPVAFIETAWRRYTKHSKNKAQEIQGAVDPLLAAYANDHPFAGAVLAGEWTANALSQLRSIGFSVAHITYQEIVDAFAGIGLNVAYDEATNDDALQEVVDAFDAMSAEQKAQIPIVLRECAAHHYEEFTQALMASVGRLVERVTLLPLFGSPIECASVEAAVEALTSYEPAALEERPFQRFEVSVRYSNGDRVDGEFADVAGALEFLYLFDDTN